MSAQHLSRWFSLSDGVKTVRATLYEAISYSQDIQPIGGFSTLRMMDGGGVKQTNWVKYQVSISGSGGLPLGFEGLDYSLPITLKCGAPAALKNTTNSFTLPPHRTDEGYAPVVLKHVDGVWVSLATAGTPDEYMCIYYPELTCFFEPPKSGYAWDASSPSTWALSGETV